MSGAIHSFYIFYCTARTVVFWENTQTRFMFFLAVSHQTNCSFAGVRVYRDSGDLDGAFVDLGGAIAGGAGV